MNKALLIFLCIFLCGCTTFTKKELYEHDYKIYNKGMRTGYIMCIHDKLKDSHYWLRKILDE